MRDPEKQFNQLGYAILNGGYRALGAAVELAYSVSPTAKITVASTCAGTNVIVYKQSAKIVLLEILKLQLQETESVLESLRSTISEIEEL